MSLTAPVVRFTRMLAGLMSLCTRPRRWTLPSAAAMPIGQGQEASHFHGRAEKALERLAARVLEHQHGPAAFASKLERPHRPGPVQLVLQSVFVGQASEAGGRRVLRGGQHGKHGAGVAIGAQAPYSAEDAFAVFPQDLGVIFLSADPKGWVQLPHSAGKVVVAIGLRRPRGLLEIGDDQLEPEDCQKQGCLALLVPDLPVADPRQPLGLPVSEPLRTGQPAPPSSSERCASTRPASDPTIPTLPSASTTRPGAAGSGRSSRRPRRLQGIAADLRRSDTGRASAYPHSPEQPDRG